MRACAVWGLEERIVSVSYVMTAIRKRHVLGVVFVVRVLVQTEEHVKQIVVFTAGDYCKGCGL